MVIQGEHMVESSPYLNCINVNTLVAIVPSSFAKGGNLDKEYICAVSSKYIFMYNYLKIEKNLNVKLYLYIELIFIKK